MTAAEWSLGAAGPVLMREERDEAGWRARAACRDADPEVFFREDGFNAAALAACRACPVRGACLECAMEQESGRSREARHGVWGGATPAERWRMDPLTAGDPARQEEMAPVGWARAAAGVRAARAASAARARIASGSKTCSKCSQEKPLGAFAARRAAADGKASWCRTCAAHPHRPPADVPAGEQRRGAAQQRTAA